MNCVDDCKYREMLDDANADLQELKSENAKLREFASEAFTMAFNFYHGVGTAEDLRQLKIEYRELGIEEEPHVDD